MNRHRLKQYEEKKNLLQFPLKCNEYDLKLSFDKKIKEYKNECSSTTKKIKKEYIKNKNVTNYLGDYIDNINAKIFNNNLFPKEKNILLNLETNFNMIKDCQEQKKILFMYDREDLEDKIVDLFRNEEIKQNKKLNFINGETEYHFNLFKKLNEEFFNRKNIFENSMDEYEQLIYKKRHLKTKFEIIKKLNVQLKEILKKEKENELKLIKMENNKGEIINKKNEKENQIVSNEPNKFTNIKDEFNNNSIKKNKRKIIKNKSTLTTNYYDIFNCYYYKNNSDNRIINSNYLKKELFISNINFSSPNKINKNNISKDKKNILKKKSITSTKMLNKKKLTIQTNNYINSPFQKNTPKSKTIFRTFSANSFKNSFISKKITKNEKEMNSNERDKEYLKNILNFLKENIEIKNNYIILLKKMISNEIKTLIWVKDFITKLIREIRYDIDDINKSINHNNKIKVVNHELKLKLKENEKLLNFCTYFHDNCFKGNKKIKYLFLKDNKKYKNIKNNFVKERK